MSERFVIPAYAALADATAAQSLAWRSFCAAPARKDLAALDAAFGKAADAWSTVEFVRYGPIAEGFRFERMAHWPERGNAVSRAVAKILAGKGTDDLSPEAFAQASVAVQGLTALERLLFDGEKAKAAFLDGSPVATRRCAVATAIAESLARHSASVLDAWRKPDGMLDRLRNADETLAREAVTRFATDLYALFEAVADRKLAAVLGENLDEVRPTLAEGWRSEHTMRAIARNLEAAETMTALLFPDPDTKGQSILDSLASARRIVDGLPPDLGATAADRKKRGDLLLLIDFIRSARDLFALRVVEALGITLGFNSLDGD